MELWKIVVQTVMITLFVSSMAITGMMFAYGKINFPILLLLFFIVSEVMGLYISAVRKGKL